MELPLEMIIPAPKVYFEHAIAAQDTHYTYVAYNRPNSPIRPLPTRVTVDDVEDEYHSWHEAQDWLPLSDPALLQPVSEFSEGEGVSEPVRLNKMTTGTERATVEVAENDAETTSEGLPNQNIRRRKSQELEKARRQKKRDESRPRPLFGDEASPKTRATRRAEKHAQKSMDQLPAHRSDDDILQF